MHSNNTLLLIISILCALSFIGSAVKPCNGIKNCKSCVKEWTFWGGNCRWCAKDNSCRAKGSWKSPCSKAEDYKTTGDCNLPFPRYDPVMAWHSVFFSAVAYSSDASYYLKHAFPSENFSDVTQVQQGEYSGYVATWDAACTIVISIRGTDGGSGQFFEQAKSILLDLSDNFAGGNVQHYFYAGFTAIWNDQGLNNAVSASLQKHPGARVLVTGHSLGGAIASIISTYIAITFLAAGDNVMLYTFGMPRVGNYEYALSHDVHVPYSFRVTQSGDPVPHLPTCIQVLCTTLFGPYHHGKEIFYRRRSSEFNYKHGWKNCTDLPWNEDRNCANGISSWSKCFTIIATSTCIDDHKVYFGVPIGDWWKKFKSGLQEHRRERDVNYWDQQPMYVHSVNMTYRPCAQTSLTSGGTNTACAYGWMFSGARIAWAFLVSGIIRQHVM